MILLYLMPRSTDPSDRRQSRKRKDSSPIKSFADYNALLRKQEVSASPVLKKPKSLGQAEPQEQEIELIREIPGEEDAGLDMGNTGDGGGVESSSKPAQGGAPAMSLSVDFFTEYMDRNVNSKIDLLTLGLGTINGKVDAQGVKLNQLESRIKQLEGEECGDLASATHEKKSYSLSLIHI